MRRTIALGTLALALGTAAEAAALPQVLVRTQPAYVIEPAGTTGALAWAQATRARPNQFAVYIRSGSSTPFRASRSGRRAFVWGGAWDGNRLVYSEFSGSTANLWFIDRTTRVRTAPPAGVNTSASENGASLSGDWLLFRRTTFGNSIERILLRNLNTGQLRLLALTRGRAYAQPGNVAGDYATYYKCPNLASGASCRAYRYRISTGGTIAIPRPVNKSQYAVSVISDGTVYFAESGNLYCGAGRRLWRYRDGVRRAIVVFGPNQDPGVMSPVENASGSTTIFYDRANCRTGESDLFKVTDP
jgi:hypothetical protein